MRPLSRPTPPVLLRSAAWWGFALVAVLLAACGDPAVGGSGRWAGPGHLLLEGSPRQMGWWQGRLLEDRIRRLVREWPDRASREASGGDPERAAAVREAGRLYASHTLPLLPERLRQELEGLAAGSGVPVLSLLALEVLRDGLRWHEGPPRLLGGSLVAAPDATALAYAPEGPDAAMLASEWIVVERRPEGATPTVVFAWPGSLGGLAGASARGFAMAAAEEPAPVERQTLRGVPFVASLRLSLERAEGAEAALGALSRTTAHRVVAIEPSQGRVKRAVVDHVDVAVEPGAPEAGPSAPLLPASALQIRWRDRRFDLTAPGVEALGVLR